MSWPSVISRRDAIKQNLPRYFTGKPCKHGHLSERIVANKTCLVCSNLAANRSKEKDRPKYYQSSLTWARNNPSKTAEYQRASNRRNPGRRNHLTANYRNAKAKRMPNWLSNDDLWVIEEAYTLAALRSTMTGIVWHVDHIVPLRGKTVSGLHVPWNLQVIPGQENVRKGNRYA